MTEATYPFGSRRSEMSVGENDFTEPSQAAGALGKPLTVFSVTKSN
jgi:hypothetical protein